MMRRLANLLLGVMVAAATLSAGPCAARTVCAMARRMDCCRMKSGIGTPRCCDGRAEVQRAVVPAAADRPAPRVPLGAMTVQPVDAITACIGSGPLLHRRAAGPAPPASGSLLAQSTSLLL